MAEKKAPITEEEKAAPADAAPGTSPYKVLRNFRCDGNLYEAGQEVSVTADFAKRYERRLTPVRSK